MASETRKGDLPGRKRAGRAIRPPWLALVSVATVALYSLLAVRYPLVPSLRFPRASWATLVDASGSNAAWHLGVYAGLAVLYALAVRLLVSLSSTPHRSSRAVIVIATWLVCSAVLLAVAPAGESHDVFDYLFRGRMMTEFGANPLVDVPKSIRAAPYNRYVAWHNNVDTYGPVWELTSAAVSTSVRQVAGWLGWWTRSQPGCPRSVVSCRLLALYVTGYRVLAIGLTGVAGWLIAAIAGRGRPAWSTTALAVWLLNPLTLISTAVGAHNDALMLVLALLSWWLLTRGHPLLALLFVILAAHVKLTALIWLPAGLLWIAWRWGCRRALRVGLMSFVGGVALSFILYAPFGGWGSLPRMLHERSEFLANSLWRLLKQVLIDRAGWQESAAHQLNTDLPTPLFMAGALLISFRMFRVLGDGAERHPTGRKAESPLWRALTSISLLYLVVGSFWFQPWYVLWLLAPASLMAESPWARRILPWLAFGPTASNVALDFLVNVSIVTTALLRDSIAVAAIWGPALIAYLVGRRGTKASEAPAKSGMGLALP